MRIANNTTRLAALVALLLLLGCVANPALQESSRLIAEWRVDDGVLRLEQAMREDPNDRELRSQYFRQRGLAVGQLLAAAATERTARHFDAAEVLYQRAQKLEPTNPRVRDGLAEIATLRRHEALVR